MLLDDDPLGEWLVQIRYNKILKQRAERRAQARACLERLSALLGDADSKKKSLFESGIGKWNMLEVASADVARAEALYHRLVIRGGSGSAGVQHGLLKMIALARNPSSAPFWKALLDLRRPRDTFAPTRRNCALAALALLTISENSPEAWNELSAAARHVHPEVRALAAYYIGRTCQEGERPMPNEVREQIADVARQDDSFDARFQARMALLSDGEPIPMDNPGGVYLFRIGGTKHSGFSRTIALLSEQTLDHLHSAIQHALNWDDDHLYSFYMNGKSGDEGYAFASPRENNPPFTDEAVIGCLGLRPKHKFLYLFDYGDCHEFMVELVDILEKHKKRGRYPRVVERHGAAPEQYPSWDYEK